MEQTERRKPRRGLTWLWMLLSLVLISGFMYWLSISSEPTEIVIVQEEEPLDEPGVLAVALDAFAADPDSYVGGDIRLDGVRAQSTMGSQAYWLEMPTGVPFLMKLDSSLVSDSTLSVEVGTTYAVVGTMHTMTDSVLTAWSEAGAIADEGQRMQAEFATSFLEARRIRASGGDGNDGGA